MAKKNLKITENFFANNIFTFNSYKCVCNFATFKADPTSDVVKLIQVKADKTTPIRFAFESKVGLVRLNEDGSIAESNILGKLLAIKKNDIKKFFSFFERNGFIFPITTNDIESIDEKVLLEIIKRLQATLELMSTITDMSRTSYEKIVRLIIYHLFAPIVELETKNGIFTYITKKHSYTSFLEKYEEFTTDSRLNDTFNNTEFSFADTIYKKNTLPSDFVTDALNGTSKNEKYNIGLFKKIFKLYCVKRNQIPQNHLIINDFLFNYYYKVGVIDHVDLDSMTYVNNEFDKNNFTTELKNAAIAIAKLIIKEEIESNLKRLHVSYDVSKLEPSWKIDSLLSALYFGLFYMRPNMETYRRCANPKCNEFFLVSVTSRKRKYCCKDCMNRDIQARHRAKVKNNE